MGGSVRKGVTAKVTHLIANVAGGEKYQYAAVFRVPIMNLHWVLASWDHRSDLNFSATNEAFVVSFYIHNLLFECKIQCLSSPAFHADSLAWYYQLI